MRKQITFTDLGFPVSQQTLWKMLKSWRAPGSSRPTCRWRCYLVRSLWKWNRCPYPLYEQVMEKRAKLIYVTRNPRDAVVSYFNHWKEHKISISILFVEFSNSNSNPRPFDPRGIPKLSTPILILARWWLDTLVLCLLWWMPSLMVVDPRYCIKAKELLYQVLLGTTPLSCRMYCPTGTPDMRKIYSSSLSKRWSLTLLAWWTGWPPFWARVSLRSRFFHGSPDMINNCHLQSF